MYKESWSFNHLSEIIGRKKYFSYCFKYLEKGRCKKKQNSQYDKTGKKKEKKTNKETDKQN